MHCGLKGQKNKATLLSPFHLPLSTLFLLVYLSTVCFYLSTLTSTVCIYLPTLTSIVILLVYIINYIIHSLPFSIFIVYIYYLLFPYYLQLSNPAALKAWQ